LAIHKKLYDFFIGSKNTFHCEHWTNLMLILKVTGIDWCKTRLISKPCMDQSVKLRTDHAEKISVKSGRGVSQGCCLSPILLKETDGRIAVTGK